MYTCDRGYAVVEEPLVCCKAGGGVPAPQSHPTPECAGESYCNLLEQVLLGKGRKVVDCAMAMLHFWSRADDGCSHMLINP